MTTIIKCRTIADCRLLDINTEPPTRTMDALLAVNVMGWCAVAERDFKGELVWSGLQRLSDCEVRKVPVTCTDEAAALSCLREYGPALGIDAVTITMRDFNTYGVELNNTKRGECHCGDANTLALALCRALLKFAKYRR